MNKTVRIILIVLFSAVFLFSAYKLIGIFGAYKEADDFYDGVRDSYIVAEKDEETGKNEETSAAQGEKLPFAVDFDGLHKKNKDIVGWIYCEDTPINYPVVQSYDNDYYLRRDLEGNYLVTGTIFADYRNKKPQVDKNYIIYGHYMKNSSIFGCFEKYKEGEYYEKHPELLYFTPEGDYRIELFAGLITNTDEFPYKTDFSEEEFADFLKWAQEKSFIKTNVKVGAEDKIVTLSTCSYEYENARCVLLGKLVPAE